MIRNGIFTIKVIGSINGTPSVIIIKIAKIIQYIPAIHFENLDVKTISVSSFIIAISQAQQLTFFLV